MFPQDKNPQDLDGFNNNRIVSRGREEIGFGAKAQVIYKLRVASGALFLNSQGEAGSECDAMVWSHAKMADTIDQNQVLADIMEFCNVFGWKLQMNPNEGGGQFEFHSGHPNRPGPAGPNGPWQHGPGGIPIFEVIPSPRRASRWGESSA